MLEVSDILNKEYTYIMSTKSVEKECLFRRLFMLIVKTVKTCNLLQSQKLCKLTFFSTSLIDCTRRDFEKINYLSPTHLNP